MELAFKYNRRAFKLFRRIILRERYIYIKFVADIVTANLLFKAGNERTGAESEVIMLALAAFERNVVLEAFVVDFGNIAVLSGSAFNVNISCVSLKHTVELCVNLFVGNGNNIFGNFNAFIVFNFDFGLYGNGRSKGVAVLGTFNKLDVGTVNGNDVCLLNSSVISIAIGFVYCVLIEIFSAICFFKQCFRCFTLAEARNGKLFAFFSYSGVNGTAEFFGGDFNGKLSFVSSGFFKLCQFHYVSS